MEYQNKVVLITGAGRGSGRQLAEAFAEQGAIIAANDISPQNVESLTGELTARGYEAKAYVEDVAKKVGVQALVKQVEDDFHHIDILVNHASVEPHVSLLDMDEWDWHRVLDVNLTGAFLVMQSVGRIMRESGGGVILNLASLAGGTTALDRSAYVTSLFGIVGFTRQAARELFAHNIPTMGNSIMGTQGYLEQNPEVAENVLRGSIEGLAFSLTPANKSIVLKTLMKRLKVTDRSTAEQGYADFVKTVDRRPYPSLDGLRNIQRLMKPRNPKLETVKPENIVDDRILRKLDESGFIDRLFSSYGVEP